MNSILAIVFGSILVNNYVLVQFLGICPTIGVSKKIETSVGMSFAVMFVVTLASVITKLVNDLLLVPYDLLYLRTVAFILVIAALVQMVEMFLKKASPTLYSSLGVYLPLITTNCIVLGVAILNVDQGYTMVETIANALAASVGFMIAIVLLASIRERYEKVKLPKAFENVPMALVTLGLMSIAFMGFKGLI